MIANGPQTIEQGETVGNGAFATVRWYDGEPVGDGHLQGQLHALMDVVGDMIDKSVFTPSTARQYLNRKLAERVYLRGVYDTPLAADRLARRDDIDAVAVLGAVVSGDTDHDQIVAQTAARKLSEVSLRRDTQLRLEFSVPV